MAEDRTGKEWMPSICKKVGHRPDGGQEYGQERISTGKNGETTIAPAALQRLPAFLHPAQFVKYSAVMPC